MQYQMTRLREEFKIDKIVTVHYFEYTRDFSFDGESHDFWELVYVDKGVVDITSNEKKYSLNQGEITFHKPEEFHALKANGSIAPNLVIIAFECRSRQMRFFKNRILKISGEHKDYLSAIIKEASKAFSSSLSDPNLKFLTRADNYVFGAEQIIKLSLEMLLIQLYRSNFIKNESKKSMSALSQRLDKNITDDIIEYMNENISKNLCFSDFAKLVNLSPTRLKTLFKQRTGMGVIQYFRKLKIERAKLFVRENDYNFTQIAHMLGYESIHSFSRQFKMVEKMSPREYAKSVKISL